MHISDTWCIPPVTPGDPWDFAYNLQFRIREGWHLPSSSFLDVYCGGYWLTSFCLGSPQPIALDERFGFAGNSFEVFWAQLRLGAFVGAAHVLFLSAAWWYKGLIGTMGATTTNSAVY